MHPFPHTYIVDANAAATGNVTLSSSNVVDILSAPPAEFDGPGDQWSPESLLCAAVADCFILTFRAVARASKFEWTSLGTRVEGVLERVEGSTRFTRFRTTARLTIPAGADAARAKLLLEKAEHGCLVTNSLSATRELAVEIVAAAA